ncbi:uncharacterized protein LOC18429630 [Amborella trichopoda]|nr:uncharacterized protein LOC18429630 [Amborella trichopoda]|eukprot:XP_006838976.2 uncharacterized protein LOC18429630 [Amborella trichopoda]
MPEMEGEEKDVLELVQLQYDDLILLSQSSFSPSHSPSSSPKLSYPAREESERLDAVFKTVMETLGPEGPGLIAITGVPNAGAMRRRLLPLARKLALLNNKDRHCILKEHGLGSDFSLKDLDRSVSSFVFPLRYQQDFVPKLMHIGSKPGDSEDPDIYSLEQQPHETGNEFKDLGNAFKELGFCMVVIGLLFARICDKGIGGGELEESILHSGTAKGRLIHYHSILDNFVLKEAARSRGDKKQRNRSGQILVEDSNVSSLQYSVISSQILPSNLWQQWHYDYGLFTVLTTPMFLSQCQNPENNDDSYEKLDSQSECSAPNGHTYLQIHDTVMHRTLMVRAPPNSFIIQVGESAEILSRGKLTSTIHAVSRVRERVDISRENFVVFLQPSWHKTFSELPERDGASWDKSIGRRSCTCDIQRKVPPLLTRLKDGMTFAEFSKETTKQYYGSNGWQSGK